MAEAPDAADAPIDLLLPRDLRSAEQDAATQDMGVPDFSLPRDMGAADLAPSAEMGWPDLKGPTDLAPPLDARFDLGPLPAEIWAVGEAGTAVRFNGTTWSTTATGTTRPLYALWASARNDVWAGGEVLLHWTGAAWTAVPSGTTKPIGLLRGNGPRDIWALAGDFMSQEMIHFDGTAWTRYAGFIPPWITEVWPVGASRFRLISGRDWYEWNGMAWMPAGSASKYVQLCRLWGIGSEVFVTYTDTFLGFRRDDCVSGPGRFCTSTWASCGFMEIWGTARDNVWAENTSSLSLLIRWDGAAWKSTAIRSFVSALRPVSANDALGLRGASILRWDGVNDWTSVWSGTQTLHDLLVVGP